MRKLIISLISISIMLASCNKPVNLKEPIRVYIEDDIPKTGINIWKKNIVWVNKNEKPDVVIIKTNILKKKSWYAVEHHEKFMGILIKPCYIYIKKINNVIIAHEFGHVIGKEDSCEDSRSIMCASYAAIHKPFEWFTEFKK